MSRDGFILKTGHGVILGAMDLVPAVVCDGERIAHKQCRAQLQMKLRWFGQIVVLGIRFKAAVKVRESLVQFLYRLAQYPFVSVTALCVENIS